MKWPEKLASAEKSQSLLQKFIGALIFNFASRAWDVNNLLKSPCPSYKKVNNDYDFSNANSSAHTMPMSEESWFVCLSMSPH